MGDARVLAEHPCFSAEAHGKWGRIHLPVAPACNVQCRYCTRKHDCVNESRPGVTSRLLTAAEAVERACTIIERSGNIGAVGIAGPGDPLANDATFETLRALHAVHPEVVLCISTNGLALSDRLGELVEAGVSSLTVTINAVMPETAAAVYRWVRPGNGARLEGEEAGAAILSRQWAGLAAAVEAGLVCKINSVLIPGVNDLELPMVAKLAGDLGAHLFNIIPLIPNAEFADATAPSPEELHEMRAACGTHLKQMTHCRQCRADACGLLGADTDMETEALYSALGEDYCEMVC
jgi:nitrogen fixation protein NifB